MYIIFFGHLQLPLSILYIRSYLPILKISKDYVVDILASFGPNLFRNWYGRSPPFSEIYIPDNINRKTNQFTRYQVVLCTAALFFSGYTIQQRTLRDLRSAIKVNREPRPSPKIYLPDRFKKSTTELEDGTVVDLDDPRLGRRRRRNNVQEDDIIIVRPTFPDEKPEPQQPVQAEQNDADESRVGTQNNEEEGAKKQEKPISRAERRRQIKEEIRRLSEGTERVYYQRRLY